MSKLSHYIKLRNSAIGCDAKQFECDKYLDCDSCLEDKIKEHDKQIRAEVIEELYNKIDEGVCDICEHKDFESDCFKTCNFEVENAKKWLLMLRENK